MTTTFVEACVETTAGSAQRVQKHSGGRPKAKRLLRALAGKQRVLVTTHMHPDPDALASIMAMRHLLRARLPAGTKVELAVKGQIGGGINEAFTRYVKLDALNWDTLNLADFDAVVLLDVQPNFAYSPLPPEVVPTAVIDHHRSRGRRPKWPFCDIRGDVGSVCSIVFSYFMELDVPIPPDLAATLLYGVESDLAGVAGIPASLDNMAVSSLTLLADPNLVNQMRFVDLPRSYYLAYAAGLANAMWYDSALITHLGAIDSLEKPAVIADFLLRFDQAKWVLVTATHGKRLILSLRNQEKERSAGDAMKHLLRQLGEGGGHRNKAGGFVPLESGSDAEVERHRKTLRRRFLRMLKVREARGQRLVPKEG